MSMNPNKVIIERQNTLPALRQALPPGDKQWQRRLELFHVRV